MLLLLLATALADPSWTPSDEETAVYKALSVRDPVPDCAEVEALAEDGPAALRSMIEHVELPPWVPMRAASCLIRQHPDQVEADLTDWVTHPDKRGLALLAVGDLDVLDQDTATRIAERALSGPHAEDIRTRLPRSDHPGVRSLVAED